MAVSKNAKYGGVFIEDHTFTGSFSAGTLGTRGLQDSITNPHENDAWIIGIFPINIGNSSEYSVLPFYSSGKIYCNFYRAHSGASSCVAVIRCVYLAKS